MVSRVKEVLVNSALTAVLGSAAKIDGNKLLIIVRKMKITLFVFRALIIHG
jgi:hypothetical protein